MNKFLIFSAKGFLIFAIFASFSYKVYAEESENVLDIIQALQQDIKTLEKAVYSQDKKISNSSTSLDADSSDVLTKHLLKLSELEEQFRILTNNFEEINFRLDKLSSRITKAQTDNQERFQDLEKSGISQDANLSKKKKKLPGSDEPKDLGGVSDTDLASTEQVQQTQSVESAGTVVTEKAERTEKILPDGTPKEQ